MRTRGETTVRGGAEGASRKMCESLRQKDSCLTQLWREPKKTCSVNEILVYSTCLLVGHQRGKL